MMTCLLRLLLSYQQMLFDPLNSVNEMLFNAHRRARDVTKLFEVIEKQDRLKDSELAKPLPQLQECIELNDMSFTYDSKLSAGPALGNISLRLERGTTTALGKSQIIDLCSHVVFLFLFFSFLFFS